MGAGYLSYVKSIATFAPTFYEYITSILASVYLEELERSIMILICFKMQFLKENICSMTPTNSASILIFNNGNGHMTWAIDRHKKMWQEQRQKLSWQLLFSYHTKPYEIMMER